MAPPRKHRHWSDEQKRSDFLSDFSARGFGGAGRSAIFHEREPDFQMADLT